MTQPKYRVVRFLQSPIGRAIEGVLWRLPPWRAITGRLVWREIGQDAEFVASIEEGKADLAAGRMFTMVDGQFVPRDTWKPDDPIQPDGWRHDGSRWVTS